LSAHGSLNQEEYIVAAIGGTGLTLAIVGAGMLAVDAAPDTARIFAYLGLALVLGAAVLWMLLLKPWTNFDDLKTPLYTGHHHDHHDEAHTDGHHDESHAVAVSAEAIHENIATAAPAVEPPPVQAAKMDAPPAPAKKEAPEVAAKTVVESQDDLTIIEGVGEKSATALRTGGVTSFAKVAETTPAELERIVREGGVDFVGDAKTWPRQAKLAAAGDINGLEDFKRRMKEGKFFDDLTVLEGVGPKIQQILRDNGVITFADLAEADVHNLRQILRAAKLPTIPDSWPKQAEFLAKGDLSGFEAYKAQLKGGRESASD
jgi:predicted flap endonuclease-1-like 5' DNA nuclease